MFLTFTPIIMYFSTFWGFKFVALDSIKKVEVYLLNGSLLTNPQKYRTDRSEGELCDFENEALEPLYIYTWGGPVTRTPNLSLI